MDLATQLKKQFTTKVTHSSKASSPTYQSCEAPPPTVHIKAEVTSVICPIRTLSLKT
uniref:Uncharacterized protein n=1 Tax=Arundo donax TaxID=35708 RepID=A0A0A9AIE1_ARUDO